jgi:hypothetical protein
MEIDMKTNLYNDTKPLLDTVSEQQKSGAPSSLSATGLSEGESGVSDVPWKKESWWSMIIYWMDELIWRRRYWKKLRMRGDQEISTGDVTNHSVERKKT